MFGKLLKYDLRSMMKVFPLVWLAAVVLAFVNHFSLHYLTGAQLNGTLKFLGMVLPILIYVAIMVALAVMTLLLTIRRFYSGLLKDEGYLAFTLPVKTWQLIVSKALAATIVIVITAAAALISVLLISDWSDAVDFIKAFFKSLFNNEVFNAAQTGVLLAEAVILGILAIAQSVYKVYAAISLGHLFNKHRAGWSVLMYLAINVVETIITTTVLSSLAADSGDWVTNLIRRIDASMDPFAFACLAILGFCLISVIRMAVYHVISERILSKRLNLE